jgi:tRNA (cmo5U34)-methyltransferase
MHTKNWVSHFDSARAEIYDTNILKFIPGYQLFQSLVLDIISASGIQAPKILVIGAGTGTESLNLAKKFPLAEIYALDPSSDMLNKLSEKITQEQITNIHLKHSYLADLQEYDFDFVLSCLVMHFILDELSDKTNDQELCKKSFLKQVYDRMKPNASLILVDKCVDEIDHDQIFSYWKTFQINNGKTTQEADDNLALINSELPIVSSARIKDLASQLGFTKIIKFFKALHVEGLVMNR